MGQIEDKVLKNGLAMEDIRDQYKDTKTVGIIAHDTVHGITKISQLVGTVVCITPMMNPTSMAIAKSLFLTKTRNTGIVLPHPQAALCTAEAVRMCHDAGVTAGAPMNFIQCISYRTISGYIQKDYESSGCESHPCNGWPWYGQILIYLWTSSNQSGSWQCSCSC